MPNPDTEAARAQAKQAGLAGDQHGQLQSWPGRCPAVTYGGRIVLLRCVRDAGHTGNHDA